MKARSKVNECQASATVRVATGDENDYNKVECHVNAAAASDYRVQDAVRVASEELALSVCDLEDRSTQVLHVEAEVRVGLVPCNAYLHGRARIAHQIA